RSETPGTPAHNRRSPNGATRLPDRVAPLGLRSHLTSLTRGCARVARFTPGYYRSPRWGDKTRSSVSLRGLPPEEGARALARRGGGLRRGVAGRRRGGRPGGGARRPLPPEQPARV